MNSNYLSIGQIARINNTTVPTLRLYDSLGLLTPYYTDPNTHYRYYDIKQSARFDLIQYMKELGMELKEIQAILASEDLHQIETILIQKRLQTLKNIEMLKIQRDAIERTIESIERYRKSPSKGTLSLEYIPARKIYSMKTDINFYDHDIDTYEIILKQLKNKLLIHNVPPVTVMLAVMAFIIILVISIPMGIIAARKEGTWIDVFINLFTQITMAIPAFFLGMVLTYIFGLILKLFQPGKFIMPQEDLWGCIKYLIFPAIAIAIPKIAMVVKFLRNSVLSEVKKDYVRTAYSKGNRTKKVLYIHVFQNALIPVITFIAMVVAEILAGSIVVERVFSVNGMGRLLVTAISNRDFPIVQAVVLYITVLVIIINFIVDILYQLVDPRVRTE